MVEVYKHNARYASEHGELALFKQSANLNRDCVGTLEAAIRSKFDGMRMKMDEDDLHHIFDAFGKERVEFILANTIVGKMYDGRIARSNKEWAQAVMDIDHHIEWSINAHPGLIDMVADMVRRYAPKPNPDFSHAVDATELEAAKAEVSAYKVDTPTAEWISSEISRHPKEFAPTGEPEYNIVFTTAYRGNTIDVSASCTIDLQECCSDVGISCGGEDVYDLLAPYEPLSAYDLLTAYEDLSEPWFRAVCENLQLQLLQGMLVEIENIDQMDIERAALDELMRDNY